MKYVAILLILLSTTMYADTFKALQFTYIGLDGADLYTTWKGLQMPNLRESNRLANWYFKMPVLAAAITVSMNLLIYTLGKALYKKNKTLAYITVGLLVAFKASAVIHNYRLIR